MRTLFTQEEVWEIERYNIRIEAVLQSFFESWMKRWSEETEGKTGKSRKAWENEGLLVIMEHFVEQNDSIPCITIHVADQLGIPHDEAEERVNATLKIIEEDLKKNSQKSIQADGRNEFAAIVWNMRKANLSDAKIAELIGRNIADVNSVE